MRERKESSAVSSDAAAAGAAGAAGAAVPARSRPRGLSSLEALLAATSIASSKTRTVFMENMVLL
jgi:hypothetical protein